MLQVSDEKLGKDVQTIAMFIRNDGTLVSVIHKGSDVLRAKINTKNCFGAHAKKLFGED